MPLFNQVTIDKTKPVLVTGATGYVAGQIIKKLLSEGMLVHAAVRDLNNTNKLKYLNELVNPSQGDLRFFKANLLEEGSYHESMQGCELVFHTASPFSTEVKDPYRELIEPAAQGTRNVLNSVNQTESVKKVVLTSSCAAVYADNSDSLKISTGIFTEANWNTSSSLTHNPYAYSKTLAEKEAWKINELQDRWTLVTINPSLVIGPGINPFATSESFKLFKTLGDGTLKIGVPQWGMGVVDVRDVAEAHFRAGFYPNAQGRYIISAHNTDLSEIAKILYKNFGHKYSIPNRILPKWAVFLVGPFLNPHLTRRTIKNNVNISWTADHSKSIKDLEIHYAPLETSINDFFHQLEENHYFSERNL